MYQNIVVTLKTLPLFLVGLIPTLCYSQDSKYLDSLNQRLEIVAGAEKFEVLKDLFAFYYSNDYETAIGFADRAYAYASEIGDSLSMVRAGRMRGMALEKIGRVNESITSYKNALAIAERNNYEDLTKFLLNNLGNSYMSRGQLNITLDYQFKTLAIREKQNKIDEIGITLNNIGAIYLKLKNYELALDYLNRALQYKEESGDSYSIETIIVNKGISLVNLNRFPEAVEAINKAFSICGSNCDVVVQKEGYHGLASAYLAMEKYSESKESSEISLVFARKQNDKVFEIANLQILATISIKQKLWQESLVYLDEAVNLAEATEFS